MSKIGWVGIGVMGRSMCGHLLAAGHEVKVHTRTKASAQSTIAAGAQWCDTPGDVARESEFVFTIVGYPADVRAVYLGEGGLVEQAAPGAVLVDMTTSEPALATEIYQAARARGVAALDAPVSGGDLGARGASLAIMVGGEQEPFDRTLPLFEKMGKNIRLMGAPGAGQHTKMSNQILIAGTMIGVVESLLYAVKSGLAVDDVIAQHQDSPGPQEAAQERGAYSVGYNTDMAAFAPKSHLTAAIWNWGPFYTEMVQQIKDGTWKSDFYWYGLDKGIVDIAPFGEMVPADVQKTVLDKKAEIAAGTYQVFTGPIKDQSGAEKVAAGTVMADTDMLGFNWFVQGVVGTLE